MRNSIQNSGLQQRADGDATAAALIALIEEFSLVVGEENAMLARGLPASFAPLARRKNELADAFERWVQAAVARDFQIEMASPPVRNRFIRQLTAFQKTMQENMVRLEAAIAASQRRIEAVMSVIREEMAEASPYGSNGKTMQTARPALLRSSSYI